MPISIPRWRLASDKFYSQREHFALDFLALSRFNYQKALQYYLETSFCTLLVCYWRKPAYNMKLTADLILQSPQYTNALRDRELDLRGKLYLIVKTG